MAHSALTDYIAAARKKGHADDQIKVDLVAAGWNAKAVASALNPSDELPVPPPPPDQDSNVPRAVVQALSTRGLEYIIMFIALAVSAFALGSVLHSTVNTLFTSYDSVLSSGGTVPFAASALIVAFPILVYLFLRLQKAELADPALLRDPSRKRAIQLTLIVTFLIGLGYVIKFLYSLLSGPQEYGYTMMSTSSSANSLLGNFIHLVITLAIAGGIFYYYWREEHRND
jgi:hypothetical protein